MSFRAATGLLAGLLLAGAVVTPASALEGMTQPQIVGGQEADAEEFGFVASVLSAPRYRQSGAYQAQYCAASLTSPTTLVTAAHCLVDQQTGERLRPKDVAVAFGSDLRSPRVRVVAVEDFAIHPGYRVKTAANDLAVIYLAQSVPDFPTIQLAQGADVTAYDSPGTSAQVAGWGNTRARGNRFLPELQVGNVRVFPDRTCGRGKGYEVNGVRFEGFTKREADPRTMLCAAGVSPAGDVIDACQGDSGGPLTAGAGDARRLIGVVSWGQQCASALPGVYTRISAETDFLVEAGVLPLQAPMLPPDISSTRSSDGIRIRLTAPPDGTPVTSFAATVIDSDTGQLGSCTANADPRTRVGTCVVGGMGPNANVVIEAISGNDAGSSPLARSTMIASGVNQDGN